MEFMIHSLRIEYKTNDKILYYPSLSAHQLKRVSILKWKVDKMIIDKFKDWSNGIMYSSPIYDHLWIRCYPNGLTSTHQGMFYYFVNCSVIPEKVNKIKW